MLSRGIRNTEPISQLKANPTFKEAGEQLESIFGILESHYRDMCDIEFTIEQGKLWMLQARVGKRTAAAAIIIAIDMVEEGFITREEAVGRVSPKQLDQLLHPQFDPTADIEVLACGLNASPGAAVGGRSSSRLTPLLRPWHRAGGSSWSAGRQIPMISRA